MCKARKDLMRCGHDGTCDSCSYDCQRAENATKDAETKVDLLEALELLWTKAVAASDKKQELLLNLNDQDLIRAAITQAGG